MDTRRDGLGAPLAPDDVPAPTGAMCGACGTGRYLGQARLPGRVVCNRCGNGRPALG
jgi:hypothetical protein